MPMEIRPLGLDGVFEIMPQRLEDERTNLSEIWSASRFRKYGFDLDFVEDDCAFTAEKGVLCGLNYQLPPFAQDRLVWVASGSIFDVAIDIRKGSPSFGHWTALRISASRGNQMLIPKGFAHGSVTLEPNTAVINKVTSPYSPEHDRSIRFDDPSIGISWPFSASFLQLSEKDMRAPRLDDAEVFEISQEMQS